jgi:hypothetical protein
LRPPFLFCLSYFSDRVLCFLPGLQSSYLYLCVTGITGMHHHSQPGTTHSYENTTAPLSPFKASIKLGRQSVLPSEGKPPHLQ